MLYIWRSWTCRNSYANGKIDILQHHAPLIDRLVPADVKVVDSDKKVDYLAIGSGFKVYVEKIYIITDQAILVNEDDDGNWGGNKACWRSFGKGKNSNFDEAQLRSGAIAVWTSWKLAKGKTASYLVPHLDLAL